MAADDRVGGQAEEGQAGEGIVEAKPSSEPAGLGARIDPAAIQAELAGLMTRTRWLSGSAI